MAKRNTENEAGGREEKRTKDKYTWLHQLVRLPLLLLIPLGLMLPKLAAKYPDKIEMIYSRRIYPVIARAVGAVSSLVPTSLAEILIIAVVSILAIVLVIRFLKIPFGKLFNRRKNRIRFFSFVISLAIFAGVMLNLFYVMWGFNHYRYTVSNLLEIPVEKRSTEDLAALCEKLAIEAAELREEVAEDSEGIFTIGSKQTAFRSVTKAYTALGERNELFSNKCYNAKYTIFPEALSKLDIAGIYIPYTAESNVNVEQPDLYVLSGAAHEVAHYFGFAREDEANFLAFYVSRFSNDAALRYSCTMMALNYCTSKLVQYDKDRYYQIREQHYTPGMLRDLASYRVYYEKYEDHPAKKVNNEINDAYLKYNGQEEGIKSYGKVVDLLLAYWLPAGS